jgi:hypothetical protein
MIDLLHRRDDGTFVIRRNGHPYHVIESDPLFAAVAVAAEGVDLPPEPVPEAPPPQPIVITNRQLFAALALNGMITHAEALAAGKTGEVPAAIDAVFGLLPAQDAFLARLTWATMREVARDHPLIAAMVAAGVATDEQVDALFAVAVTIT